MDAATKAQKDKLVAEIERLAREQGSGEIPLPNLVKDPSVIDSLWKRLEDWITSLFPDSAGSLPPIDSLVFWFKMALYAFLAVVAGVIIWLLVRLVMRLTGHLNPSFGDVPGLRYGKEQLSALQAELEAALQANNFREALKVRWKIFVNDSRFPASRTPVEWAGNDKNLNELVSRVYVGMFGGADPSRDLYDQWDRRLVVGGTRET